MFEKIRESVSSVGDSLDETGVAKKDTSLAKGERVIDSANLESEFSKLELLLIQADVEKSVAEELIKRMKSKLDGTTIGMTDSMKTQLETSLQESIEESLIEYRADFDEMIQEQEKPVSVLFTGINGVGKTTTIAKLAHRAQEQGYDVVLANGDTYRAGAEEQIQTHTERLDVPLIKHEQGSDPAAVVYDAVEFAKANDFDLVLADTAGRLHTDDGLMKQLEKIHRVVNPTYTVFVDEATAGQDATNRANEFCNSIETDGFILTKADAADSAGAVLSIPYVTEKSLFYVGSGESYSDLESFAPEEFAEKIVSE